MKELSSRGEYEMREDVELRFRGGGKEGWRRRGEGVKGVERGVTVTGRCRPKTPNPQRRCYVKYCLALTFGGRLNLTIQRAIISIPTMVPEQP